MQQLRSFTDILRSLGIASVARLFLAESFRAFRRLIRDPEYRRFCWLVLRYGGSPRYAPRTVQAGPWTLTIPDAASFLSAYREIFVEEIYSFPTTGTSPLILDGGANIGLSVLFFASRYPGARIIAYEADPAIFEYLRRNIEENHVSGVELHHAALWNSPGIIRFRAEGADGGRIETGADQSAIPLNAVELATILGQEPYDFVKIDIEGAEEEALAGCRGVLSQHRFIFVEYHSFGHRRQRLAEMLTVFEQNGFRVHIHPPFTAKRPFLGIPLQSEMDMQLNLFFWKDTHETP